LAVRFGKRRGICPSKETWTLREGKRRNHWMKWTTLREFSLCHLHNAKAQASAPTVLYSVASVKFPELLFSVGKQIQFSSSWFNYILLELAGLVNAQAVCNRPAGTWFQNLASSYVFYSRQRGAGMGSSKTTSLFFCRYRIANVLYTTVQIIWICYFKKLSIITVK
jgi:hypothetical protein